MDMIKLTGLWKKDAKDGSTFYQGKLGLGANILIFKNKYHEKDSDPDLVLYIAKAEKRDAPAKDDADVAF